MTVGEQRFMETVSWALRDIANQLKVANNLKALELKGRQDLAVSPEMVDEALKVEG